MALLGLGVLLGAVLEDNDLLALAVLQDLSFHGSASDHGSTELGIFAVQNCQNLIEGHGGVGFSVQLFNVEDVAFLDAVLLAAGHDNCLHFICTYLFCRLALEVFGHTNTSTSSMRLSYYSSHTIICQMVFCKKSNFFTGFPPIHH